jgi:hypothetical protein
VAGASNGQVYDLVMEVAGTSIEIEAIARRLEHLAEV